MAELKLGTQIGGNLVWHQGILDLNPVDDKLFFRQFDVITDIGGQTINGGLSLKGDVDTTGRMVGVGANGGWGSASRGAFSQIIENDTSAHWLLTSNRKDGSGRAGIQVLTSNTGIMRLYTDNITKYVDIAGGQVSVQATMPSSASHLTRKDYVDAEIKRSMDYTDSKDAASNATVAALDTRVTTLDAQNVKITGNQSITGIKTFSSHITVPAADPTAATQAAHKGYVDKLNATSVKGVTAISPVISTGGINPVISIAPASRASSGSMSSNDKIKLDDLPADALSRAGGTMKPNGFIKLDGMGGINSITGGKEYSIFRDHNNGNVTVGGAGGDLYLGYTTDSEAYTTQNVLLYAPLKWMNNKTGHVLVDSDGFIPWASIKDRIGLEGKSKNLSGPTNFDEYEELGFYNLYAVRPATGTLSVNPPPFDHGTMVVVGSGKDLQNFVTQIATDKSSGVTYIRTRNDGTMTWSAWNKQYSEKSKPTPAEVGAVNKTGDTMTGALNFALGTFVSKADPAGLGATLRGNMWAFVESLDESNLSCNAYYDGAWKKFNDSTPSYKLKVSQGGLALDWSAAGQTSPIANTSLVYHQGFKPTPADVGAVAKTGDTMTGNLTTPKVLVSGAQGTESNALTRRDYVDTQLSGKLNTYGGTITGPLRVEAGVGAAKLVFADDTGSDLAILHDDSYTAFREGEMGVDLLALTGGGTPTVTMRNPRAALAQEHLPQSLTRKDYVDSAIAAGDALQVSKSGDNMTGNLTVPKVLLSAAQGSEINALTRKDYVDAIDAKNVAKAGDTMTGKLIVNSDSNVITINSKATDAGYIRGQVAGVNNWYIGRGGATDSLTISSDACSTNVTLAVGGVTSNKDLFVNQSKVYHQGFKPTAAEVGAAPVGFGLGTYGTGISTVLGDCNLRRQSGFFQGSNIAGIPNTGWTYLFNQAHGNAAGYFGYLAINFAGTQAWIGGQEGGTQKGPYELVKRGDSILTGRVEVNAGANPMIEYHIPGNHAVCTFVDGAGNYRLSTSNGGGGEVGLRFQADTGGGMYVVGNGNFNDVNIRSDRRLKKNFVKISGALDKVSQLCAYTYDKKQSLSSNDYSTHEVGLIAQDVQLVLPEAVTEVVNPVDNLNVLTISNSGVNALLVEAIKELRAEVNQLRQQIAK